MAETTEKTGEKKLSVAPTKTLTLKGRGVEQGVVRQSFSHGRTKAVVVEKVKSRAPGESQAETPAPAAPAKRPTAGKVASRLPLRPSRPRPRPPPSLPGVVLRTLTEEERTARARALGDARLREAEERKIAEEEALIRKSRDGIERIEREAAEARKAEEDERRKHELETKLKAEQEAKKRFGEDDAAAAKPRRRAAGTRARGRGSPAHRAAAPGGAARPAPAPKPTRSTAPKSRGRLTLVTALSADEERERSVAAFRRRVQRLKGHAAGVLVTSTSNAMLRNAQKNAAKPKSMPAVTATWPRKLNHPVNHAHAAPFSARSSRTSSTARPPSGSSSRSRPSPGRRR